MMRMQGLLGVLTQATWQRHYTSNPRATGPTVTLCEAVLKAGSQKPMYSHVL